MANNVINENFITEQLADSISGISNSSTHRQSRFEQYNDVLCSRHCILSLSIHSFTTALTHSFHSQVYKNLHQRIFHRTFEGPASATLSSLEMTPSSPLLQEIFAAAQKFQTSVGIDVQCDISILDLYKRNLQWKIPIKVPPPTTHSPNLLGLEKASIGDPDNSPLTGQAATMARPMHVNQALISIFCCYLCYYAIL